MAEGGKTCTGDCIKCGFQQQTYCAAQRCYYLMDAVRGLADRLGRIEGALAALAAPGEIIAASAEAQTGPGAENSGPES